MRYSRCKQLFGDNFKKIQKAKIILFGVGGVGGHTLDALYRTGVKDITIVDFDKYEITNQNRQIGSENLGKIKTEVLAKLYPGIKYITQKVTKEWVADFDFDKYDIVIDAIDDIPVKVALANKNHNKFISSCGGAKRVDPTKIEISSIWKTINDPFAKKFRYELKKSGFDKDFEVVFSKELPIQCEGLGSFIGVTGSMGYALASLALKKIVLGVR